jgi:WD40 repeat protein
VALALGGVAVTTYSPVVLTPLENSSNLFFTVRNEDALPRTLEFSSMLEIQRTRPPWIAHFFKLFGLVDSPDQPTRVELAPNSTQTLEFYLSKDLGGGTTQYATLPFRFRVSESGAQGTLEVALVADDYINDLRRTKTAAIAGRILDSDQRPVEGALITVGILNESLIQSARTDREGRYRVEVLSVTDAKTFLGSRTLPYRSVDYFMKVSADGYGSAYRESIAPRTGETVNVDVALPLLTETLRYRPTAEVKTDGTVAYWRIRFAGESDRIVAIQGQHPPVPSGNYHFIGLDLSGNEVWRIQTEAHCLALDVSADGGLVAVTTNDGFVYVVAARDGRLLYKAKRGDRGDPSGGTPAVEARFSPDGQKLLVDGSNGGGGISVLEASSGRVIWVYTQGADGVKPDAYKARWSPDGDRLVVGGSGLLSMFTSSGALVWRTQMGESPLWLEFDAQGNVYAAGKSRYLFSFDREGRSRWIFRLAHTANEASPGLAAAGDLLLVPTFNGLLQALKRDGSILWQQPILESSPAAGAAPAVVGTGHNATSVSLRGDRLVVGSRGWQTLVYDRDGTLRWSHTARMRSDFKGADPVTYGNYTGTLSVALSKDGRYIAAGYADSTIRIFTEDAGEEARLSNLSVRTTLPGEETLIVGAVVRGSPTPVLLRAAGPALGSFGLVGMPDPRVELFTTGSAPAARNDDWAGPLASVFAQVGAFPFVAGSKDAALNESLTGSFTLQVRGSSAGVVLVEAYEVAATSGARLINVSARNRVGTGDNILIAGFSIAGQGAKTVLIRAVGPTLREFGVGAVLDDPRMVIFDSQGRQIAANDDWPSALVTSFSRAGAFPLPVGSRDAAWQTTLTAGAGYTVQVSGANGQTGEALIEVYELQ